MLPSFRLILLVMAAAPLFLAGTMIEGFTAIGVVYVMILAAYTFVDGLLLPRRKHIRITRKVPGRISLDVATVIEVEIENLSRRTVDVSICENVPGDVKVEPSHCVIRLGGGRHRAQRFGYPPDRHARWSSGRRQSERPAPG